MEAYHIGNLLKSWKGVVHLLVSCEGRSALVRCEGHSALESCLSLREHIVHWKAARVMEDIMGRLVAPVLVQHVGKLLDS